LRQERHRPEQTTLYRLVQQYAASFTAHTEASFLEYGAGCSFGSGGSWVVVGASASQLAFGPNGLPLTLGAPPAVREPPARAAWLAGLLALRSACRRKRLASPPLLVVGPYRSASRAC